MTDVTKNITEISKENNAITSTHKKRSYRDIPLLIFIVAVAIFMMLGCTLITDKNTSDNLRYEESLATQNQDATDTTFETVVNNVKNDENVENARLTLAMATKEAVACDNLPDGRLKVWFEDGTVDVFGDSSTVISMVIINDDTESVPVPLNEEQAVNNAMKAADAGYDETQEFGKDYTGCAKERTFSGKSASNSASQTGKDPSVSTTCYSKFKFSYDSTWGKLIGAGLISSATHTGGGSLSFSGDYTYTITASASASQSGCDKTATASVSISSPTLTLKTNESGTPSTVSCGNLNGSTWVDPSDPYKPSRSVKYYASANYGLNSMTGTYYTSATSAQVNIPFNNINAVSYTSSAYTTYGGVTLTAKSALTGTNSATARNATALKIDNQPPAYSEIAFIKTDSLDKSNTTLDRSASGKIMNDTVDAAYNGDVTIRVKCNDPDSSTYNGTYTYVTKVVIKNVTQNYSFTAPNVASSRGTGYVYAYYSVKTTEKNYLNGKYDVEITDYAGNVGKTTSVGSYYFTDISIPEYANGTLSSSMTVSRTGNDFTADDTTKWTDAPLRVSISIKDQVGDAIKVTDGYYKAGVKSFVVTMTNNGKTHTLSVGKGVSAGTEKTDGAGIYKLNTYTFDLPYDVDILDSLAIDVTDNAGNVFNIFGGDLTDLASGIPSKMPYSIDTVAPEVKITDEYGISTSNDSYKAGNRYNDVAFTLTVRDLTYNNRLKPDDKQEVDTKPYYYVDKGEYNNGSGIEKILVYTSSGKTSSQKVTFYVGSKKCEGVYDVTGSTICTELSIRITLPYDKASNVEGSNALYIVAIDKCGNVSDGTKHTASGTTDSYATRSTRSYADNSYTFSDPKVNDANCANASDKSYDYYVSQDKTLSGYKFEYYVIKDYYTPQVIVTDKDGTVIASTNGYDSTSLSYVFPWSNDHESQQFIIHYVYGCSGGDPTLKMNGTNISLSTIDPYARNASDTTIKPTTVNNVTDSDSIYGSQSSGLSTQTLDVNTTYKVHTETINVDGVDARNTYTMSFKNKENVSTEEITITTQIDVSAPETFTLMGFAPGNVTKDNINTYVDSSGNATSKLTQETVLTDGTWYNIENSKEYWALFKVADNYSGIAVDGNDLTPGSANDKTGAHEKYYGIDGKYDKAGEELTQSADAEILDELGNPKTYSKGILTEVFADDPDKVEVFRESSFVFAFRYVGAKGTYTYYEHGYVQKLGNYYYVVVRLFDRNRLETEGNCSGFKTTETEGKKRNIWDVSTGTFLDYSVAIRDFLGNTRTYGSTNVAFAANKDANLRKGLDNSDNAIYTTNSSGTTFSSSYVLRYYVDPFPTYADLSFYTFPSDMTTSSLPGSGSASTMGSYGVQPFLHSSTLPGLTQDQSWGVYDDGFVHTAEWTMSNVIMEIEVKQSLSEPVITWGQGNRVDYPSVPNGTVNFDWTVSDFRDNKSIGWVVFYAKESKDIKLGVQITNKAGASVDTVLSKTTGSNDYYFILKQDTTAPELTKVFFADNPNETTINNSQLAFDAKLNGDNYTFTLDKNNSSSFVTGQTDPFVWATQNLYAYFIVSDRQAYYRYVTDENGNYIVGSDGEYVKQLEGYTMGSGAHVTEGFKVNDSVCRLVEDYVHSEKDKSERMYVYDGKSWGLTAKTGQASFNFTVKDNMDNATDGSYVDVDKNGFKLFPVVDTVDVESKLQPITWTEGSATKTYTTPTTVSKYGKNVNVMKGEATTKTDIDLTINFTTGISGVKMYLKEVDWDEANKDKSVIGLCSPFDDFVMGKFVENNFDYAANGWGYYVNKVFVPGAIAYQSSNANSINDTESIASIRISMTSLKKRLYLLAVSGVGRYYLIDLGSIFIDSEPVQFDSNMTIFAVESSASMTEDETHGEIAYANMQTIWTNVVGDAYTNGKVYIYYQLSDGASGIDDSTVVCSGGDYNGTKLEKILVTGIPVWFVDGYATNVRVYTSNEAEPTVEKDGNYVRLNGLTTKLLYSKVTAKNVYKGYIDEVYYRLLIPTATKDVVIDARDISGNVWNETTGIGAKNTLYSIKIDTAPVKVSSTTKYVSTDKTYYGSMVAYTNDSVKMSWRVEYGSSGFGYIAYTRTNNFQGIIDQYSTVNGVNVPKVSISKNGTFVLEYLDSLGNAQKYDTYVEKTNEVNVRANAGVWQINGQDTAVNVATKYYSSFGTATYTIDYASNKAKITDSSKTGPARIIYNNLDIPIIDVDGNGYIIMSYLDYKGDFIQIDTGYKRTSDIVKLNTKLGTGEKGTEKNAYYWAIDGKITTARVAAAPIYPNSIHDVTWEINGVGANAIITLIDKYEETYAELRAPSIRYADNNEIIINFYNGTRFVDVFTGVNKPVVTDPKADALVNVTVIDGCWAVQGKKLITAPVNYAYYSTKVEDKTWVVCPDKNYIVCEFIVGNNTDMSVTYTICAYNNVIEELSKGAEEKDIVITYPKPAEGTVQSEYGEYEQQKYNAKWNISYGADAVGYVDYEVIDDKGNLFTNKELLFPVVSFSETNTVVLEYYDSNDKLQIYDTGVYAIGNKVTLAITNPSSGAYCVVSVEDNEKTVTIPVSYTKYSAHLTPTWIYDFKANTITLSDSSATGLAHNVFNTMLNEVLKVTIASNTVSLTVGAVTKSKQYTGTNGMVTLTTREVDGVYKFHINGEDMDIPVHSSYPTNFYDVEWTWNAISSSNYSIVDNIVNASVRMRVPTFTNDNNKVRITYLTNTGTTESKITSIDWPSDNTFTLTAKVNGGARTWYIDNVTTGINLTDIYHNLLVGTIWDYDFASSTVQLTMPVSKTNAHLTYIIKAANNQPEKAFNRPVSEYASSIVSIDITAPVINLDSGNFAELATSEDIWHALAKSLRISIYDGTSGIGDSGKEKETIDNVQINYEDAYITGEDGESTVTLWLVKCDDGLYRAYNGNKELYYFDKNIKYTIKITDRAGNVTEKEFIPKVDTASANVSNIIAYDKEGNKYAQGTPSVDWLKDTGISTINWMQDYAYVTMDITYGKSGYTLYVSENYKKNVNGGLDGTWTELDLDLGHYERIGDPVYNASTGLYTDTIKYYVGKGVSYLYKYYMFRALSNAQNTELNVYKSYKNSSIPRATEIGDSSPDSINYKLRIELESYESADQGGAQYAEISIGKRVISSLIAIDKTKPTLDVVAKDSNKDFYGYYNADGVWEIPDGEWVNNSVTMTVTLDSPSAYISGNAFFYRTYAKNLDGDYVWSEWTMVLPTGRVYVKQGGKWTQQSGSSSSISIEGKIRYYNDGISNDQTVMISNYASALNYKLEDSTNNVVYEYFTMTGAGIESEHRTVGRIDDRGTASVNDDLIYGIKIDTNTPNVIASGKATYSVFDESAIDIQEQLKAAYNNVNNVSYVVTANAVWTYYNSVVMNFTISNVGYSGVTLKIGGEVFDVITYEDYKNATQSGSSSIYRYYYVGNNGETRKDVAIDTFAGTEGSGTTVYARIDNTTPIVYVNSIDGTKATNWGWSAEDNLYSDSIEYWYVSETEINLGVGIVENNAFVDSEPYSGYEIEYQVNGEGEWLPVAGDVLRFSGIGENVINGNTYKFRITSGAGLYYYIGTEIIDNHKNTNTAVTFHGQNIVNTIENVTGSAPVQSHVVKGEIGSEVLDYHNVKSEYQMFVDANRYSYTYNGKVYLGKDYGYDINTNNFMSYTTRESDANGEFSDTFDTQFHRGDVLELTYVAKHDVITDHSYYGSGYNYFHSYTVGSPDGSDEPYCAGEEKTGKFKVQFIDDHINLVGYFIAEVRVDYGGTNVDGQDVFYKQTAQGSMATTGIASYVYTDGTTVKSVNVALSYEYHRYNENTNLNRDNSVGIDTPSEVGAYYVYTYATADDKGTYGSFRITGKDSVNGATDYKDFVIKYFAKPVQLTEERENGQLKSSDKKEITTYYLINNETDFYYVDNNYYNLYPEGSKDGEGNDISGMVVPTPSTYLDSNFILNADLTINKRLEGIYTGTFNANGADNEGYTKVTNTNTENGEKTTTVTGYSEAIHTITIEANGITNGKHSVFERVDGTVKNLAITLSDVMTISLSASANTNVGLLAGTLNGLVHNVSVTGDIVLDGVSTTVDEVNVGGLAGTLGEKAVLGQNSDLVYVDVRITNNGKLVNNANVSTLAGYVKKGAKFNNVQVFGEVTVYGVNNSVNIGTVYGNADEASYDGATINYFANNAFLNDYTVSGASSSSRAVTINGLVAVNYASMVGNDATVAGNTIEDVIIGRLYSDFGYQYNGTDTAYGIGTEASPLIIDKVEHLMAIDGYMNLHFVIATSQNNANTTLDMSDYDATVAIHKVFNGSLDTQDGSFAVLSNFAGSVDTFDGNYFGLFGQLNGKVNNLVFSDIAVDFTYEGDNALYAGLVAGKIYNNAVINNIVLIGTQKITSTSGAVYAGGIVGSASGGRIYDVFSMNNISVNGTQVVAGGIVGIANDLYLYNEATDGAIYLLGRVEGNASSLVVGAAIGSGALGAETINVYAIKNNTYNNGAVLESKPIGSTTNSYGIKMVEFTDDGMRGSSFASGDNAFGIVFGGYYPLRGSGTADAPFIVESAEDFNYVNIALYANYSITKSITFTEFTTIGEGLVFSGSINGSGGDNISAEESSIASLSGLDAPLVYNNIGNISNISLNIVYENTVKSGETFYFGAIAIYNSGTIKNVTVAGSVDITSEANDTTLYVSGFVGINYGGDIILDGSGEEISKIQNSISALDITVNGGGTAYVGGYAGVIEQGQPKFSYGLATGTITITDVQTVYAGLFAGASYGECEWVLGEAASIDYTYTITVDGVAIPKVDENGDPIEDNFYGVEFIK